MEKIKIIVVILAIYSIGITGYAVMSSSNASAQIRLVEESITERDAQITAAKDAQIAKLEAELRAIREMMEKRQSKEDRADAALKKAIEGAKNEKPTGRGHKPKFQW